METEEINNINENKKSNCDMNNISKKFNKMIEILQMDKLDENECDIINKKLDAYKEKQKIEIENLERQLNDLKYQNSQIINNNRENNSSILLNDNQKKIIKEEIIKEIEQKINDILKQKEEIFSQQQNNIKENNINNQKLIEHKFLELEHIYIIQKIEYLRNKLLKTSEIQKNPYKESKNNIYETKICGKKTIINKNKEKGHNNIRSSLTGNLDDNLDNSKIDIKESKKLKHNFIQDEKNNKIFDNKQIQNMNNYNNLYKNDGNKIRDSLLGMKDYKKEDPKKIDPNYIYLNKKNPEKKPTDELTKLFSLFNNIFFTGKEQIIFKDEKINENTYKILLKKYNKFKEQRRENDLFNYFDDYLKANVFKIFQRKIDNPLTAANVEYNIKVILNCFNINNSIYNDYFKSGGYTNVRNRKKSTEAAIKFRREFNVGKEIINEEELIKKLDRNNCDINKVFRQMYG